METFLTKSSQKKIKLIAFLLAEKQWRTMDELRNYLGVSSKSILLYLQELAELFKSFNGKISIINMNNQRFYLRKEEGFPIYSIYLHYYQDSYNYHLIDFMYKVPDKNLADFAEIQFTSISTVFRYAKLLVNYFKQHDIIFHTFKLNLEAEETSIRCFFYYFYWDSTRNGGWPFLTNQIEIEQYLLQFEKVYGLHLNQLQNKVLGYWLTIILERSKEFPITTSEEKKRIAEGDIHFPLVKSWLIISGLYLAESEQIFLYGIIMAFGILDGHEIFEQSHAQAHLQANSSARRSVLYLSQAIEKVFDFSLDMSDRELQFNFLAFHERSELFWGNPDVFFHHSYLEEVKLESPRVYQKIEEFRRILIGIADDEVVSILSNWEQLFLSYYYILDYYGLLLKSLQPIKILIQDDLHHTHRLWLMHKIEALFGNVYSLTFYDYMTKVEEVDLVLSNHYIDTGDKPLLLMKNIPSERNWRNLEKLLYQLMLKKDANKKEN
ncbi:helix-turn-helix domain-containing protein [Enterococcus casseliflavus]|uniref:helix-turn-helix domain-containing protein n=1 Tax=Enterococcus casseliflavus TaxID=37734 RepID=UPI0025431A07|nr:helix-turn-helix domain-containing protein [Enterococcus casseliflavus]MDK4449672.1 helix-turn-helix domain-containing protein [Enterococcus casseliflavus]